MLAQTQGAMRYMVNAVTNRNCVYHTAYNVVWCPKYRHDILVDQVGVAVGEMLDAICLERGWSIIAKAGASKIVMENLTRIRNRIKAGKRMRARLHRWAWRQLQTFVEYKAKTAGIAVEYVNPAYTSQTCSACGNLGKRIKHRFECSCGLRAHADLNASRNLARIAETAVSARAVVNTPNVGDEHGLVLR